MNSFPNPGPCQLLHIFGASPDSSCHFLKNFENFSLSAGQNLNYFMCGFVAKSCPTLCDPWTVDLQAPLSMGLSRQEYWSRLPFPHSGDIPNPGIKPEFLMSPALAGRFFTTSITWEAKTA